MPRTAAKPTPGDRRKPACTVPSQLCERRGLRTGGWGHPEFHHLPRPRRQQRSSGRAGSARPPPIPLSLTEPCPLPRPRARARPYVLSWLKLANSSWPAPASPLWLARFMAASARRPRTPLGGSARGSTQAARGSTLHSGSTSGPAGRPARRLSLRGDQLPPHPVPTLVYAPEPGRAARLRGPAHPRDARRRTGAGPLRRPRLFAAGIRGCFRLTAHA